MARLAMRDGWVEARQGYKGTAFPVWFGEEPQGAVPAGQRYLWCGFCDGGTGKWLPRQEGFGANYRGLRLQRRPCVECSQKRPTRLTPYGEPTIAHCWSIVGSLSARRQSCWRVNVYDGERAASILAEALKREGAGEDEASDGSDEEMDDDERQRREAAKAALDVSKSRVRMLESLADWGWVIVSWKGRRVAWRAAVTRAASTSELGKLHAEFLDALNGRIPVEVEEAKEEALLVRWRAREREVEGEGAEMSG